MPSTRMPSVPCLTCSPARTVGHASGAPSPVRRFGLVYSLARKFLTHSAESRGASQISELFPSHHWFWYHLGQPRLQLVMEDTAYHLFSVVPSSTESDDLPRHPAPAMEVFTILTWICGQHEALSLITHTWWMAMDPHLFLA